MTVEAGERKQDVLKDIELRMNGAHPPVKECVMRHCRHRNLSELRAIRDRVQVHDEGYSVAF